LYLYSIGTYFRAGLTKRHKYLEEAQNSYQLSAFSDKNSAGYEIAASLTLLAMTRGKTPLANLRNPIRFLIRKTNTMPKPILLTPAKLIRFLKKML
jgi:hypothetical protein